MGVRCIGRCVYAFLVALVFDVLGLVVLFVGIFADPRFDGKFYGDFLIYSGSLAIFSSLPFWIMWYIGNILVSDEEAVDGGHLKKRSSFAQLARKLSERLSGTWKGEQPLGRGVEEAAAAVGQAGASLPRAGKVTWGKSTIYLNGGYDGDSLDSHHPPHGRVMKRPEIPPYDSMTPPTDCS